MTPLAKIDSTFYPKLISWGIREGVSPISAALVMNAESGLDPTQANRDAQGNPLAVGLNQFWVPSTFKSYVPDATPEEYLTWPATQQLDRALKYFSDQLRSHPAARKGGARDLYWLNFLPATYKADAPDDYVVTADPVIVAQNRILSQDGQTITPGSMKAYLDRAAGSGRYKGMQTNLLEMGASLEPLRSILKTPAMFKTPVAKFSLALGLTASVLALGYVAHRRYA